MNDDLKIPRGDDILPLSVFKSARILKVIKSYDVALTPNGICSLSLDKCDKLGRNGLRCLRDLQKRCRSGEIWGSIIRPNMYDSFSDYVIDVAKKANVYGDHSYEVLMYYFGFLNVEETFTYAKIGAEMLHGGKVVSRARVQQIAATVVKGLFTPEGIVMFREVLDVARKAFVSHNCILKKGELLKAFGRAFPCWDGSGTTEFSIYRLLKYCGMKVESGLGDKYVLISGTKVAEYYDRYLELLNDPSVSLEGLSWENISSRLEELGLGGLTHEVFLYVVERIVKKEPEFNDGKKTRWGLFLRLMSGIKVSYVERRRYVVARALKEAGPRGLTKTELKHRCVELDPEIDIGEERNQDADACHTYEYDMDGLGNHLMVYGFSSRRYEKVSDCRVIHRKEKRYSLDCFYRDERLVHILNEAALRLRKHMERYGVGTASTVTIRKIVNASIAKLREGNNPGIFSLYDDELPSACIYSLMRANKSGGLIFYDHPNIAHPAIASASNEVPEMAMSWLIYKYFMIIKNGRVTQNDLVSFCTKVLGMDPIVAGATVIMNVKGKKVLEDGKYYYYLKQPKEGIDGPTMLLPVELIPDGKYTASTDEFKEIDLTPIECKE